MTPDGMRCEHSNDYAGREYECTACAAQDREECRAALAASQAEVSALKDKNDACCAEIERLRADAKRLQGGRERAYFKGAEDAAASLERARLALRTVRDELKNHALLPVIQRQIRDLLSASPALQPADTIRVWPCANCRTMRSKAEGGNIFTVCDACWDIASDSLTIPRQEQTPCSICGRGTCTPQRCEWAATGGHPAPVAAPQPSVPAEPRHDWQEFPGTGWLCSRCGAQKRVYGVGELSQAFEYRHKGSQRWQHFAPACGDPPAAPPAGTGGR